MTVHVQLFRWVWSDNPSDWLAWATFLVGSVIAVFAARITWLQTQLQRRQLRHDLYDRRLQVYFGAANLISHVFRNATVTSAVFGEFINATHLARFLFETDVTRYLDELRENARKLMRLTDLEAAALKADRESGTETFPEERISRRGEIERLVEWFIDQLAPLPNRFDKYFRVAE